MSYYHKSKFSITNHALIRIKQRIRKCKNMDDNQIIIYVNELLNNIAYEFCDHQYYFYKYPYSDLYNYYFYVSKNNHCIITFTPMSNYKKLGKI